MAKKATNRPKVDYETATFEIEGPKEFYEHVSSLIRAERIAEAKVKELLEQGMTYGYVNITATDEDGNYENYKNYDLAKLSSLRLKPLEPGQIRILENFSAVWLNNRGASGTIGLIKDQVLQVNEYWLNSYKATTPGGKTVIVPADKAEAGEKPATAPVVLTRPTLKAIPERTAPASKTDDAKKAARRARRLARKAVEGVSDAQEAPVEKAKGGLDPEEAKKAAKRARAQARRARRKAEQGK